MKNELQERLTRELDELVEELTIAIPARLGTRQQQQIYRALTDRQAAIRERVRHLRKMMTELPLIEAEVLYRDQAGFGSEVLVEDLKTKEQLSYTLTTGDSINLDAGEISIASPVGNALLGRRTGDEVEVVTPRGVRRLRVLNIVTLFDAPPDLGSIVDDETPDLLQAMA